MVREDEKSVRVRFAPSPTGPFHLGSARTALFNWLFARQNAGTFILRIEDTDIGRSAEEFENQIYESLSWLGLEWDEGPKPRAQSPEPGARYKGEYGPYRQSERTKIYRKYLEKLLDEDQAYHCYCTKEELESERQAMLGQGLPPKYSGHCREIAEPPPGRTPELIRFKTPEAKIEFKDIIRGHLTFDAGLLGDLVIAKNLDSPLYNFAVTVDDEEMKISHVIRGEDHISNTPKQILVIRALGFHEPAYAHIPLILGPDRKKISKRDGETSLLKYRDLGYLPEAMVNFLALLGWHPKDEREILNAEELIKEFDLKRLQKAGAVFDQEKLEWLNSRHLRNLSVEEISRRAKPFLGEKNISADRKLLAKVIEAERERMKTLSGFVEMANFFFELPDYDQKLLIWKKSDFEETKRSLETSLEILETIEPEEFSHDNLASVLSPLIKDGGDRGVVYWPLRVAVSGLEASPDPIVIIEVLGKEETLRRVRLAVSKLSGLV